MAFVDTHQVPEGKITSVHDMIRALRGAAADELSAANLYSEIIAKIGPGRVADRLTEIRNDEVMHLGGLLFCLTELDAEIGQLMEKGAKGV